MRLLKLREGSWDLSSVRDVQRLDGQGLAPLIRDLAIANETELEILIFSPEERKHLETMGTYLWEGYDPNTQETRTAEEIESGLPAEFNVYDPELPAEFMLEVLLSVVRSETAGIEYLTSMLLFAEPADGEDIATVLVVVMEKEGMRIDGITLPALPKLTYL